MSSFGNKLMAENRSWQKGTRWYYCHIEQDLWGNWVVCRVWGDRVSRRSGSKEHLCQSCWEEAQKVFEYVSKRRKWHKSQVADKAVIR